MTNGRRGYLGVSTAFSLGAEPAIRDAQGESKPFDADPKGI
jgi:hypothetical protein